MKKSLMAATAALAVCAMALAAAAQQERNVTTLKDKGDTVKINVSGGIVLDYVWRSKELTLFTEGYSTGSPPLSAAEVANADSENTFEGYAAVRLDAELSDKVSAVIEVGTLRVAPVSASGINEMATPGGGLVGIREAQIRLNEFLMPELSVKAGIADWKFDVRGKGNAFAFDPRHSQSISKNLISVTQEGTDDFLGRADQPSEQYPVGGVVTYVREAMQLDLVLLPGVIEFGTPCQDEALYALDFWYKLDEYVGKGSRAGVIAAIHGLSALGLPTADQNHTVMYTIGGGVDLKNVGVEGLEIYGEVYKQFGKVAENVGGEDYDAKGLAFQIGAEYRLPNNEMGIWFGINFTYVSGDGDDTANTDFDTFLSYENVSDLLIVEDMYFGLDIDSNYTALKISAGAAFSLGQGKNNLEVKVILGLCSTQEDLVSTPVITDNEDKLGTEFDLCVKYHLSKQASISGAFAILTGSDVMEDAMGGSAVDDAEDSAMLYTLGLDVKF